MNERLKELALECYNPYSNFDFEKFVKLIGHDLAKVIEETGKQCAYTTHDLAVVECTIVKCRENVENYFKD